MKIRNGFVSNSSSSCFTVRVPRGTTEEEIRAKIEEHVGEMKNFFIPSFRQQIVDTIMECKGDKVDLERELKFEIEWNKEHPDHSTEEQERRQAQFDGDLDYYNGGFSDNGDGAIQLWLCNTDFKIDEDGFFMENYSGY